jgi:lambda family phage portal protein
MTDAPRSRVDRLFDAAESVALPALDRISGLVDAGVQAMAPQTALARKRSRAVLGSVNTAGTTAYEAGRPGRKRRFHYNTQSGDSLSRASAQALRNQARHLERNNDITTGILDKLVDFSVGPNGIMVEPAPKDRDGNIHRDFAKLLRTEWERHSESPEVTWTHDRGQAERLAQRTHFRDGETLGQLVQGPRGDRPYAGDIPVALELLEPDVLPHDYDDWGRNIRQGIERNNWGRPTAFHVYRGHPGDDWRAWNLRTKRVAAENMLHHAHVTRIGQLRGISVLAPVITRLQDIHEYEDSERLANKMAADLVMKITRGAPEMWGSEGGAKSYDPEDPPIFRMDGGMVVANTQPGEDAEFFNSGRPNTQAVDWVNGMLRRTSGGVGLSYSAVARDYNGTYSAQRQELVENWPHYHALTGRFVARWTRPHYQAFARWVAMVYGVPADLDVSTLTDAMYLGPPMPWIDPEKEANGKLIMLQACLTSSARVMRELGRNHEEEWRQIASEIALKNDLQISSSAELPAGAQEQARPSAPEPTTEGGANAGDKPSHLRAIK